MAAEIGNRRLAQVTAHLNASTTSSSSSLAQVPCAAGKATKKPLVVLVTGCVGNIAYAILPQLCKGNMLGEDQPIELRLLDIPPMAAKIEGVIMEIEDGGYELVTKIVGTTDYAEAFADIDVALLIGAKPRGKGMVRADLLKANAAIFAGQGKALNQYAKKSVKVVVVGNPANTNALIASAHAPSIPARQFTAMTRLDQSRAKGQLAKRLGVSTAAVTNVVVWGNHSATQYPDVNHASVRLPNGTTVSVRQAVGDDAYLNGDFIKTVATRGGAVIKARGLSSAASAANACVDHMRSWVLGTPPGQFVSMAVPSDGSYGVPAGVIYSFPVTCDGRGNYAIVQNLAHNDFSRKKLIATAKELFGERAAAGLPAVTPAPVWQE
jgi:malate dehydrogenase